MRMQMNWRSSAANACGRPDMWLLGSALGPGYYRLPHRPLGLGSHADPQLAIGVHGDEGQVAEHESEGFADVGEFGHDDTGKETK